MKFDLAKRLSLANILPQKGGLYDQIICKDILDKVKLTQEVIDKTGLKPNSNGGLEWDPVADEPIEVEFSEAEKNLLKETVNELDKNKSITPVILALCLELKSLD